MKGGGGYARLYRGIFDHPAFRNWTEESAFIWLVLRAAWKPVRVRYKDRPIYLKRGQLALSVRDFARGFGWSKSATERFLDRLKIETMVRTETETGVTIITICNYSKYQDVPEEAGTVTETKPGQSRDTEQIKEINKDSSALKKRAQSIPSDWVVPLIVDLSPQAKQCAAQWPKGVYERQAEGFANYWTGNGKPMKDWKATWANWVVRVHPDMMRDAGRAEPRREKTYLELVREGKA